jgi:hypothetical protein
VDTAPTVALLLTLLGLLVVIAFSAGTEVAMLSVNRYRVRTRAAAGERRARALEKLLSKPDQWLGANLVILEGASVAASTPRGVSPTVKCAYITVFGRPSCRITAIICGNKKPVDGSDRPTNRPAKQSHSSPELLKIFPDGWDGYVIGGQKEAGNTMFGWFDPRCNGRPGNLRPKMLIADNAG